MSGVFNLVASGPYRGTDRTGGVELTKDRRAPAPSSIGLASAAAVLLSVEGLILLNHPTFFVGGVGAEVAGMPYIIVNGGLGLVLVVAGLFQAAAAGALWSGRPGADRWARAVAATVAPLALIAFVFTHPWAGWTPLPAAGALVLANKVTRRPDRSSATSGPGIQG